MKPRPQRGCTGTSATKAMHGYEDACLDLVLAKVDPDVDWKLREHRSEGGHPLRTIGDLLRHPSPPAELLRLMNRVAQEGPSAATI